MPRNFEEKHFEHLIMIGIKIDPIYTIENAWQEEDPTADSHRRDGKATEGIEGTRRSQPQQRA